MSKKKSKKSAKEGPVLTEEEARFERDLESWESGEVDPYEDAEVVPEIVTETEEILAAPEDMARRSIDALKAESWGLRMSRKIDETAKKNDQRKRGRKRGQQLTRESEEKTAWIQNKYDQLRARYPDDGKLDLVRRALVAWMERTEYISDAEKDQISDSQLKKMSRKITN